MGGRVGWVRSSWHAFPHCLRVRVRVRVIMHLHSRAHTHMSHAYVHLSLVTIIICSYMLLQTYWLAIYKMYTYFSDWTIVYSCFINETTGERLYTSRKLFFIREYYRVLSTRGCVRSEKIWTFRHMQYTSLFRQILTRLSNWTFALDITTRQSSILLVTSVSFL